MQRFTKTCKTCNQDKPAEEYYAHPKAKDGLQPHCKNCCIARAKQRYYTKRNDPLWMVQERVRGREKHKRLGYATKYKNKPGNARNEWRTRHREKSRTHTKVARAIRDGTLVKPSVCSECGADGVIHGHHEDYSKPLDVVWLCKDCHKKRHRKHD